MDMTKAIKLHTQWTKTAVMRANLAFFARVLTVGGMTFYNN